MQRWNGNLSLLSATAAPLPADCVLLSQRDDNLATIAWLAAAWLVPPLAGLSPVSPSPCTPLPVTRRPPHSLSSSSRAAPVVSPLRRSCPFQFAWLPRQAMRPDCPAAAATPLRTGLPRPWAPSVRDRLAPEAAGQGIAPVAVSGWPQARPELP